jgi:hypothetical protein
MRDRLLGMMQTVWSDVSRFLNEFYNKPADTSRSSAEAFKVTFPVISGQANIGTN